MPYSHDAAVEPGGRVTMGICFHMWHTEGRSLSDTRPGLALSRFVPHEAIFIATVTRWAGRFFGLIGPLQSNLFAIPANATSMEPAEAGGRPGSRR